MSSLSLDAITGIIIEEESRLFQAVNLMRSIQKKIKFEKYRILIGSTTPNKISTIDRDIEIITIPRMTLNGYNNFCVKNLHKYCYSDFGMIMQLDGYPIDPTKWRHSFYEFDYIGAPWLENEEHWWADLTKRYVGNGGFSLRSKKLMEATASLDYKKERGDWNEDAFICCLAGGALERNGFKFADRETAEAFSVEVSRKDPELKNCFGFHGKFNLNKSTVIASWR